MLQIQSVLDQTTKTKIRQALVGMSTEVDAMFDQTVARIKQQSLCRAELALKSLMWTSHARRPLYFEESREALAIDAEDESLDEENMPLSKHIINSCLGLVSIDEQSYTIRLVHLTVKEYLERRRDTMFASGEEATATICLTFLSFDVFYSGLRIEEYYEQQVYMQRQYPFMKYATQYWNSHVQQCSGHRIFIAVQGLLDRGLGLAPTRGHGSLPGFDYKERFQIVMGNRADAFSPLHAAAFLELTQLTEHLLGEESSEPNILDAEGRTPLSLAADAGEHKVIKQLLARKGVAINIRDVHGTAPLVKAAVQGHIYAVRLLVEHCDIDINITDNGAGTAMSKAAGLGHTGIVQLLLEHGAKVDSKDNDGETALSQAASSGAKDVVQLLLDHGAKVDSKDNGGETALSQAASSGAKDVMQVLLEHGGKVDSRNKDGETPLRQAADSEALDVVRLLLEHGADVDCRCENRATHVTLFPGDTSGEDTDTEETRLRAIVEKNQRVTPLLRAAIRADAAIVQVLLEYGAEVNFRGRKGGTPLLKAASRGATDTERFLPERRAHVHSRDIDGRTSLLGAVKGRYTEGDHRKVVRLLLENGADINAKDFYGRTALIIASREYDDKPGIVEVLLEREDIEVEAKDLNGKSSLMYVAASGSI